MIQSQDSPMLLAALELAERMEFAVFPLRPKGKQPLTKHGFKDASTDSAVIRQWWGRWPQANIGGRTGIESGIIVLDIDKHGDADGFVTLANKHSGEGERLPRTDTLRVRTGGGGLHVFLKHPGGHVQGGNGKLGPGLDVKADGGYIVLPPSIHPNGKRYRWDTGCDLSHTPIAEMPGWVRAALNNGHGGGGKLAPPIGDVIPVTERNDKLASLAGTMRRRGTSQAAIEAALLEENATKCRPPLPDDEVRKIARSVARYEPAADPAPVMAAPLPDESKQAALKVPSFSPAQYKFDLWGNADRYMQAFGQDVLWSEARKKFFVWTGLHWMEGALREAEHRAELTVRGLFNEARDDKDAKRRDTCIAWAVACSKTGSRYRDMLTVVQHRCATDIARFDQHPFLLNTATGTLDLRTGMLREPRREDLLTLSTHVSFDPSAECPRWGRFIREVTDDDDELGGFLQRLCGYWLTGSVREQNFPILHGEGRNGKTVFFETVLGILGDHGTKSPDSLLTGEGFAKHPTELAKLWRKRLAVACEVEQGSRFRLQRLKELTGDRRQTARFLYGDFFDFDATCKLLFVCNHKPRVEEDSEAVWRRVQLIPFDVQFAGKRDDKRLAEKLCGEQSGILRWMLEGCLAWQRDGLRPPARVQAATQDYRRRSGGHVAEFLDQRALRKEGAFTAKSQVMVLYRKWCSDNSHMPLSNQGFTREVRKADFVDGRARVGGKTTLVWHDLVLREQSVTKEGEPC